MSIMQISNKHILISISQKLFAFDVECLTVRRITIWIRVKDRRPCAPITVIWAVAPWGTLLIWSICCCRNSSLPWCRRSYSAPLKCGISSLAHSPAVLCIEGIRKVLWWLSLRRYHRNGLGLCESVCWENLELRPLGLDPVGLPQPSALLRCILSSFVEQEGAAHGWKHTNESKNRKQLFSYRIPHIRCPIALSPACFWRFRLRSWFLWRFHCVCCDFYSISQNCGIYWGWNCNDDFCQSVSALPTSKRRLSLFRHS